MLTDNPKLKEIVGNMIDNADVEMTDVVNAAIEEKLKKARLIGIEIGWQTYALRAIENIKDMKTVDEIKAYFQGEADKMAKQIGKLARSKK